MYKIRLLSFLDSAYFDSVLRSKEHYKNPAIQLVATENNQIVGLLDIEYERQESTLCSRGNGLGEMIWHIAVHPGYRRRKIASQMLSKAVNIAKEKGLNRLEAWTRDDKWVRNWYSNSGFEKVSSYLHVYIDGPKELKGTISSNDFDLLPMYTFAHYIGEEKERIQQRFDRVHECVCFEKKL